MRTVEELLEENNNLQNRIEGLHYEIAELEKRDKWLRCLETAGVDNWEGYDYAKDLLDEDENN